tara:strand:+ start:313 stop:960 length:648 start_codon:yes stop_codon:yes gene_type:complete
MEPELPINSNKSILTNLTNFINRNKKLLTIILSSILILILIFFLFLEFKKKKRIEISEKFNKVTTNYKSNKNNIIAKDELTKLILSKDKTYAPLSLYFLIDNKIIDSRNEINNFFDELIKNTSLETEVKNLVIYKKALYNSEFEEENNLITQLNPLINSESIWKSHALYLLGEYFFYKKENKKSKEFFEQIINLKNANPEIKIEAQKRILRDLSE